jgi:16S rRNA G966 N2-methylase RsmD
MTKQYLPNTKQQGEALELLSQLETNQASLIFLDPQYEKVGDVSRIKDYPLHYQTEYQIIYIVKEATRVLKPSGFCLL